MPEIVPSVARELGSWALTVAAKTKSTRLRKMTEGLFGGRASKKLSPVPKFLALDSLHCISTCSALLRCVLGGLGGCGSQSLRPEKPRYLVRWLPGSALHHHSRSSTVACADLRRYVHYTYQNRHYFRPPLHSIEKNRSRKIVERVGVAIFFLIKDCERSWFSSELRMGIHLGTNRPSQSGGRHCEIVSGRNKPSLDGSL